MGGTEPDRRENEGERKPSPRVLDAIALSPLERTCEIVFGILMFISVTAATEIGTGGRINVHHLFLAAFGCNLAWGLIDGVVYLLQLQFERFRHHRALIELRAISTEDPFRERVKAELPPYLGNVLTPDAFSRIRGAVHAYSRRRPPFWNMKELAAALAIWALVAGSTLPLVVPFIVVDDARLALHLSHATAVLMLFALGWHVGRWAGASPGASGAVLAVVGSVLAVLCVLLGG
jgi:hypothetical protein